MRVVVLVVAILLGVVGIVAVTLGIVALVAGRVGPRIRAGLASMSEEQRARGASVTYEVLCPGGQSASGLSVGGVGLVAVFDDRVEFGLLRPVRTLAIPRDSITSVVVETTLRVPGRYRRGGPPFVVVSWGEGRIVAFQTQHAESIRQALA